MKNKGKKKMTIKVNKSKETKLQRAMRIFESNNGMTMKTRRVESKKKYSRKNFKIDMD